MIRPRLISRITRIWRKSLTRSFTYIRITGFLTIHIVGAVKSIDHDISSPVGTARSLDAIWFLRLLHTRCILGIAGHIYDAVFWSATEPGVLVVHALVIGHRGVTLHRIRRIRRLWFRYRRL